MEWYKQFSEGFRSFFSVDHVVSIILIPTLILIVLFWFILVYYRKKALEYQKKVPRTNPVLNLKLVQYDLSVQQTRLLRQIIDICCAEKPSEVFKDPVLFEGAINGVLSSALEQAEGTEPLDAVCKNIIGTYEKIYHHSGIRQPIAAFQEIEDRRLVYISSERGESYIGKITGRSGSSFSIRVYGNLAPMEKLVPGETVRAYVWRTGDAGYYFNPSVVNVRDAVIELGVTGRFEREPEPLHIFIDAIIPCTINPPESDAKSPADPISGVIFRLNEFEVIIRTAARLGYGKKYVVAFKLADFNIKTEGQVIRYRYVQENKIYHHNFKFTDISKAARTIIRNHMTESLS